MRNLVYMESGLQKSSLSRIHFVENPVCKESSLYGI